MIEARLFSRTISCFRLYWQLNHPWRNIRKSNIQRNLKNTREHFDKQNNTYWSIPRKQTTSTHFHFVNFKIPFAYFGNVASRMFSCQLLLILTVFKMKNMIFFLQAANRQDMHLLERLNRIRMSLVLMKNERKTKIHRSNQYSTSCAMAIIICNLHYADSISI